MTRVSFLLLAVCLAGVLAGGPTGAASPPNIVVFLTDDQDQLDSSVYGDRQIRTPHMERLARAGVTFTQAFAASPTCAPSRAALLTGLMPARNGAEDNHAKARAGIRTLPAYFAALGYEVVAFGKVAHYEHARDYGFQQAEFDRFMDHRGMEAATAFLAARDAKRAKPLLLLVGTQWPHRPWPETPGAHDPARVDIPPTLVDTPVTRAFRARYYHAVTKADDYLGAIYDAARTHLGERTLFLMSSDHGAQWPLGKWNLYDAGIRVPLLVAWPGVVKPGTRTDAMVSWIDLLPTLVEAAGGTPPPTGIGAGRIDGRSFLDVLRGKRAAHRDRIFATHTGDRAMNVYPIRAVRTLLWKYIRNLHPEFQHTTHIDRAPQEDEVGYFRSWERAAAAGDAHASAVLRRYRQRPADELYDLARDPLEQRNLAADPAQASRLAAMRADLDAWLRDQGDTQPVFHPPVLLEKPAGRQ